MIWGLTNDEREKRRDKRSLDKRIREETPRMVFAFLPVTLVDGRSAWFEFVMKHYYHVKRGDYSGRYWRFARYQEIVKPPRPPRVAGDP